MRLHLILLLILPFAAQAQIRPPHRRERKVRDSLNYYDRQIFTLRKQAIDSLEKTQDYQAIKQQRELYSKKSDRYVSLNYLFDLAGADYDKLNSSIEQKGFPALNSVIPRLGIGITIKAKKMVWDITLFSAGIDNNSKKGDEKITASFHNALQLDVGYDFLKSPTFNLYPYAGLSLRMASLRYEGAAVVNPNYTDITDIVQSKPEVSDRTSRLGYQAGVGFEVMCSKDEDNKGGTIVFIKVGTNGVFGKEKYKIEGISYDPDIKYGMWIVTVGLKLFGR